MIAILYKYIIKILIIILNNFLMCVKIIIENLRQFVQSMLYQYQEILMLA